MSNAKKHSTGSLHGDGSTYNDKSDTEDVRLRNMVAAKAIADIVRLSAGSVLELERQVGEPIDLYVDGRLIARGEVVLADERLAITMTDIVKPEK